jgi:hypothetical protein
LILEDVAITARGPALLTLDALATVANLPVLDHLAVNMICDLKACMIASAQRPPDASHRQAGEVTDAL